MSVKSALHCKYKRYLKLNILLYNCRRYQHKKVPNAMNSKIALKQIKDLQKFNSQNMVTEAFKIYTNLHNTQQNEYVINEVLNCCKQMLKNKNDINTTKVIEYIKNSVINTNENVYVKNTLISIYSQCKDITNAIKVFDSIPKHKKTIVSINAMMTCFINNKKTEKAISLYEYYSHSLNLDKDDVSNLLFIKACGTHKKYDKKGEQFIQSLQFNDINSHSIKLITTLIDFYGKTDMNKALQIFDNVPINKKSISSVSVIMKCFIDKNEKKKK
eukprot:401854_1